jgi:hypothetical protein
VGKAIRKTLWILHGWDGNVKMGLKTTGWDWIDVAKARDMWWTLNTVKNCLEINELEFLI